MTETFNMGEYMVNAAITNLKDGVITETLASNYIANYRKIGWITDEDVMIAVNRIMAIAAGQPDPVDAVAEEVEAETETESAGAELEVKENEVEVETEGKVEPEPETAVDYNSMTLTALKELAKERGLSGYSAMAKAELIALLEVNDSNVTD